MKRSTGRPIRSRPTTSTKPARWGRRPSAWHRSLPRRRCRRTQFISSVPGDDPPPAIGRLLRSGAGESHRPGAPALPAIETRLVATPQMALEAAGRVARAVAARHRRGAGAGGRQGRHCRQAGEACRHRLPRTDRGGDECGHGGAGGTGRRDARRAGAVDPEAHRPCVLAHGQTRDRCHADARIDGHRARAHACRGVRRGCCASRRFDPRGARGRPPEPGWRFLPRFS